jgi:hypothetical protein
MLKEYEDDHVTWMDIGFISAELRRLTSGCPFLVSRMRQIIDGSVAAGQFPSLESACTQEGLDCALKSLTDEKNALYDDMAEKLSDFPDLKRMLQNIIFSKEEYSFNPLDENIVVGLTFGLRTAGDPWQFQTESSKGCCSSCSWSKIGSAAS